MRDIERGRIPDGATVVCTLTGHGLKDPEIAMDLSNASVVSVEPTNDDIKSIILDGLS